MTLVPGGGVVLSTFTVVLLKEGNDHFENYLRDGRSRRRFANSCICTLIYSPVDISCREQRDSADVPTASMYLIENKQILTKINDSVHGLL